MGVCLSSCNWMGQTSHLFSLISLYH